MAIPEGFSRVPAVVILVTSKGKMAGLPPASAGPRLPPPPAKPVYMQRAPDGPALPPPPPKPPSMGGPRRLPQGDATPAQLAEARLALGPAIGVERFQEYVEERYGKVPRHVARAFLRSFDYNQMYSAPADTRAGGKTATTGYNDSWFLDLIALEKRTPKADPFKYIMLAINVYTGYIFAKPLKSTGTAGPEGTAAVFTSILEESAGLNPPQGPPKSVTTDASTTEWGGDFRRLLIREEIAHRVKQPEDRNAIGKLDSTVGQIKAILFRGMGERERKSWRTELPELVRQYNNDIGHEGRFGTKPSEVRGPEPTELRRYDID